MTKENVVGGMRKTSGTFTNTSGSTGGDIPTGLQRVLDFTIQPLGTAVEATVAMVNETFPLSTAVTIKTAADSDGYWSATGY
jgi:hypothetical protein